MREVYRFVSEVINLIFICLLNRRRNASSSLAESGSGARFDGGYVEAAQRHGRAEQALFIHELGQSARARWPRRRNEYILLSEYRRIHGYFDVQKIG